jgi:hypothetical protein
MNMAVKTFGRGEGKTNAAVSVYCIGVKWSVCFYCNLQHVRWHALNVVIFCCVVQSFTQLPCLPNG